MTYVQTARARRRGSPRRGYVAAAELINSSVGNIESFLLAFRDGLVSSFARILMFSLLCTLVFRKQTVIVVIIRFTVVIF